MTPDSPEVEPSKTNGHVVHDRKHGRDTRPSKKEVTAALPVVLSDKPAGLTNLGNTCFMNSTLQCLASTRLLIPKLEIFGRDQHISMVVTQCQEEAVISVLSPCQKELELEEGGGPSGDAPAPRDSSDSSRPLTITLEIGPETMTGRLRQTIRGIRKYETSKYRDEDVNEASCSNNKNSSSSWYNAYRPGEVHELVSKNFRRGAQHDAHELLRTIVDMMKKDQTKAFRQAIMKHYGLKKAGEGSDPTLVDMVKALDEKVRHKTFVDEVFGGELVTTQTCLTCNRVKSSHEQFLDLSLPLRVVKHGGTSTTEKEKKQTKKSYFNDDRANMTIMRSLHDCLTHFTEAELLTGSNVVECENCHKLNLEKIEAGEAPEVVFPALAAISGSEKSSSSSPDSERKTLSSKKEERKKRRTARQKGKVKSSASVLSKETVEEDAGEKEAESMPLVENHYPSEKREEERSALEGYVVIGEGIPKEVASEEGPEEAILREEDRMEEEESEEPPPLLLPEVTHNSLASSKRISESLQNLNVQIAGERELDEVAGDSEEDFDLGPAVEGVGGSASDEEDERQRLSDLDFNLPTYDKFRNFELQVLEDQIQKLPSGGAGPSKDPAKEGDPDKPTTADEGFSEGENSMSVDNDAAAQGPSASSSRNSLTDSDETTSKSSSNDEVPGSVKGQNGANFKIPKVTKCPCSRQQRISRPPENLTIHFKRFQMSMGGFPTKINDHVNYPMILDLTEFCARDKGSEVGKRSRSGSEVKGSGSEEGSSIFDEEEQVLYALYGIVEHSGSMNWGHYVAYVRSSENDKRWWHISDSSVAATALNGVTAVDAYILFYERIRGEEKRRRLSVCEPATPLPEAEEGAWKESEWDTPNAGTSYARYGATRTEEAAAWNDADDGPAATAAAVVWDMDDAQCDGYQVIGDAREDSEVFGPQLPSVPSIVIEDASEESHCGGATAMDYSSWNSDIKKEEEPVQVEHNTTPIEDWDEAEAPPANGESRDSSPIIMEPLLGTPPPESEVAESERMEAESPQRSKILHAYEMEEEESGRGFENIGSSPWPRGG